MPCTATAERLAAGVAEAPGDTQQRFCHLLQEYLKDHRLLVDILGELSVQLASLVGDAAPTAGTPALLQRVQEKVPSARLEAYLAGRLPRVAPAGSHLPQQVDENLRLLGILAAEMRRFQSKMDGLLQERMGEQGQALADAALEELAASGADAASQAVLMAAVTDALAKETSLIENVAAVVALDTPPEQLSSYATLLRIQPYLDDALLGGVLSWGGSKPSPTDPA